MANKKKVVKKRAPRAVRMPKSLELYLSMLNKSVVLMDQITEDALTLRENLATVVDPDQMEYTLKQIAGLQKLHSIGSNIYKQATSLIGSFDEE